MFKFIAAAVLVTALTLFAVAGVRLADRQAGAECRRAGGVPTATASGWYCAWPTQP